MLLFKLLSQRKHKIQKDHQHITHLTKLPHKLQKTKSCSVFFFTYSWNKWDLVSYPLYLYAVFVRFPFIRFPWSRRSLTVPFTVVRSVDFRGMRCSSCEVWYVLLFISFLLVYFFFFFGCVFFFFLPFSPILQVAFGNGVWTTLVPGYMELKDEQKITSRSDIEKWFRNGLSGWTLMTIFHIRTGGKNEKVYFG